MEEKVMPIADKLANNRYLLAIRDGFNLVMPLFLIGSMASLVVNFPLPGYSDFMNKIFGVNWSGPFMATSEITIALMTIFIILGISYSLAKKYKLEGVSAAATALLGFFLLDPFKLNGGLSTEWMGTKGIFLGIFIAIITIEIIRIILKSNLEIKMPTSVPLTITKAISSLIPFIIVMIIFNVIRIIFTFTAFETINNFVYKIIQTPLMPLGDSLGGVLIANFFSGILWSAGIHGGSIVESIMNPIWLTLSVDNLQALNAGRALPHIVTQQFQQLFLQLGGCGSTLALGLLMAFGCKSDHCKKLSKVAIMPGIFNINESIIFGLPIISNPLMIIPFVITPLVLGCICYLSISLGLLPPPSGVLIPWYTPPIIGGFLISGIGVPYYKSYV